ncbi:MAG TPA: TIGR03617 family F420-dependent LLM class oxidoreductase [Tepidisphaeraceae bacterium]|nr:TIGR03617 family F420-dependent LLM class oxidoreductase [Tepidisphaeraceae bacterium]
MFVETSLRQIPMPHVPETARLAEELGFDGLTFSEVRTDPFLVAAVAAAATERIELATSVAIAFPRSPMVVAQATHNLQELSRGRFSVGLGTQVKGHIERRFSTVWDSPGPRLREYVQSLHAIWDCWQHGSPLNYQGRFYRFTLMTPEFNFGPTPHPLRIDLAAINPYNLETAATLARGLRVHGFNTAEYLRDVIWPVVDDAAERAGRPLDDFEMIGGGFLAAGADEHEVREAREQIRRRVAFYGSTRAYAPIFERHGWGSLGPALRELIGQGRWGDLHTLVNDEVLDRFCMAGTYRTIAERVGERLGGIVDRVSLPLPENAADYREEIVAAVQALKALPTARQRRAAPVAR